LQFSLRRQFVCLRQLRRNFHPRMPFLSSHSSLPCSRSSLPSTLCVICKILFAKFYCALLRGNVLFPCRFRKAEQIVPERIARQKSPDTMATIAALQINMMGRSVRCKRLLRYVMRVPLAW
jgi:hypothetical protein